MKYFLALWLVLAPSQAMAWELTCEQSRESLNDLYTDPFFARPEHRMVRLQLAEKLKQHTPKYCGFIYET